jgi:hypothetical protein
VELVHKDSLEYPEADPTHLGIWYLIYFVYQISGKINVYMTVVIETIHSPSWRKVNLDPISHSLHGDLHYLIMKSLPLKKTGISLEASKVIHLKHHCRNEATGKHGTTLFSSASFT